MAVAIVSWLQSLLQKARTKRHVSETLKATGSRRVPRTGTTTDAPVPLIYDPEESGHVCIQDLLASAATLSPRKSIIAYPPGNTSTPVRIGYACLHARASRLAAVVRSIPGFQEDRPILLHLDSHEDNLSWFWAVLLAEGLPVMPPPLSQDEDLRRKHINCLCSLLEAPICITREDSRDAFGTNHGMRLTTVESLAETATAVAPDGDGRAADLLERRDSPHAREDMASRLAMLMLTSGSTGNAKAVMLTHGQVLAAVQGKTLLGGSARGLTRDKSLLNWIGFDHVASIVEIHLPAMALGLDQVHVQAADMVSSPRLFLDLLSEHRVSRSFAPNFFLAKLLSSVPPTAASWQLDGLDAIISGGEANDVEVCAGVSDMLAKYGARRDVITPGFGMTETCAGCIYNTDCPAYDLQQLHTFASLGRCNRGIEMRVTVQDGNDESQHRVAQPSEPGDFEVRGRLVFKGYYRDEKATAAAFTRDGWFRTGDQAAIDSRGSLNLMGRGKDVMNINGVKIGCADVQTAVDKAVAAASVDIIRAICFPSRAPGMHTEQVTVVYVPAQWPLESEEVMTLYVSIVEACILCTGSRPAVVALEDASLLPTTSLGKVPRSKMRMLFEKGVLREHEARHEAILAEQRSKNISVPTNELEIAILDEMAKLRVGINDREIGLDTPVYEMGFTSMDLIRFKNAVDKRFATSIPIITFIKGPTARSLAAALSGFAPSATSFPSPATQPSPSPSPATATAYDPVVPFRTEGYKTPLWLVHPGVGEVLVFIGLAQHLADDSRPIYGLRAPGFEQGDAPLESITQAVELYRAAILARQPRGPYALAGYSYGSMLAFEMAKLLESRDGARVSFLGSFNLPPHIKFRMRQLNWNMCLLHLAFFLGLVPESYTDIEGENLRGGSREAAVAAVLGAADKDRMLELRLDETALRHWAALAFNLQSMAADYEPSGSVEAMDVLYASPLAVVAASKEDWVQNHLRKWDTFCRTDVRFHPVGGAHYTMLGPEHVAGFAATLKKALRERGL